MTVILLELNEINMHAVRSYSTKGLLPNFTKLIADHGISETTSEASYANVEPWIQWVTAHTGLDYKEHGIFRLGDIKGRSLDQIWERLEERGVSVGAVSPMNAENRCKNPAFFMPDPWTQGRISGPRIMRELFSAVVQTVNDNAQSKLTVGSALKLVAGLIAYARPNSLTDYRRLVGSVARKRSWAKALILDRLLADIFLRELKRTTPGFASLFLNAGAHIQHHYMFNSTVYEGNLENPEWYITSSEDPVLDAYSLYDRVIGDIRRAFPDARLFVATGLHQVPHDELTFYWRLKDHEAFLRALNVPFKHVEPRMSRDFVVVCGGSLEAQEAERQIVAVTSIDHQPLFAVDNRGSDLFVTLVWPHDVAEDFQYRFGNTVRKGLREQVAFVAIKNGEHDGLGYLIDTGGQTKGERFPLKQMPLRIAEACGVALAA